MLARENDSLVPPSGQQQNSLFFGFYDNGKKNPQLSLNINPQTLKYLHTIL